MSPPHEAAYTVDHEGMKLDLAVVETARLLLREETATAELESVAKVLREA
ncbi:hypothetical protein MUO93_09775 [Candidatus Bathyarchaeota archaeon]|jgi:hypothetical protein|nr:hypothetical protein [Candidatus Bathyarchaeota archaeon]